METRSELQACVSFQVYSEGRNEERTEEERQKENRLNTILTLISRRPGPQKYARSQYFSCYLCYFFSCSDDDLKILFFRLTFCPKLCSFTTHLWIFAQGDLYYYHPDLETVIYWDRSTDLFENCTRPLKCACSSNEFYHLLEVTADIFRDQT